MNDLAKGINIDGSTVSARDDAFFYNIVADNQTGIYSYGNDFEYSIVSANSIQLKDGLAQVQGRRFVVYPNEVVDVAIDNGTQNMKRRDLIVLEFARGSSSETLAIKVVKGTESETPVDPTLTQDDTLGSGTVYQMPLYRVRLNGVNLEGVDDMRTYIKKSASDVFLDSGKSVEEMLNSAIYLQPIE